MQRISAILLLALCLSAAVFTAATKPTARKDWAFTYAPAKAEAKGYFEGKKLHIEFKVQRNNASKSVMFFFKPLEGQCPGFVLLFSLLQDDIPMAYVAGACKSGEQEPELRDELAFDFDREQDKLVGEDLVFKGTVEYTVDFEEFEFSKYKEIYFRTLIHNKNTPHTEYRAPF